MKSFFVFFVFLIVGLILSCSPEVRREPQYETVVEKKYVDVTRDVYVDPSSDVVKDVTVDLTKASFWGLPAIEFIKWRPNYSIKASTDNGALENRVWEGDKFRNPNEWSIFEYSQILFYQANYKDITESDATVDNNVLFYKEYQMYKRTPPAPLVIGRVSFEKYILPLLSGENLTYLTKYYNKFGDITNDKYDYKFNDSPDCDKLKIKSILTEIQYLDKEKSDVSFDFTKNQVVINLNTPNSDSFKLKKGAKIAVIATQRPAQWGSVNDYTIIDSIPKSSCLQVSDQQVKDNTSDRSVTRKVNYIVYNGGTQIEKDQKWSEHWFTGIILEEEKIILEMPKIKDGNTAKIYWDNIDKKPIAPFMLFWILIEQK